MAQAEGAQVAAFPFEVGYAGGVFVKDPGGLYELKLQGVIQPRFALESEEFEDERDLRAAFFLRRVRVTLRGHALLPTLTFKLQPSLDRGVPELKDAYLDYAFVPGVVHVRAGQWKRPFSRQQIASGLELDFLERAITDRAFGAGRDVGAAVLNNFEESPRFEYAVGVFNGLGVAPGVPDRFRPSLVSRVGFNFGEFDSYDEADLEGGPFRFGMGTSARFDFDFDGGEDAQLFAEADFIAKYDHFSTTGALYIATAQTGASFSEQGLSSTGFHIQTSYAYLERYQPALRYAVVAPVDGGPRVVEAAAAFNVYFVEHAFKWQSDLSLFVEERPQATSTDVLARTQLTFVF